VVILHADVAGSTALVQHDETVAHERIQNSFRRFSETIEAYRGVTHELRGDALVAEFDRASNAVCAGFAFQADNSLVNATLEDDIRPELRIGISMGEVVIADNTITGEGVVLAQRVEQLADPGGMCITSAIHEALPRHMPFDLETLGEQAPKGFDDSIRVYRVELTPEELIPLPGKLAAILFADVWGDAHLDGEHKESTQRRLSEYLDHLSDAIEEHQGKVVHTLGDGVLSDFGTASEAFTCAISIQRKLASLNHDLPDKRKVQFRIGVNLGEVTVDGDNIYGDGAYVAGKMENFAEPGEVCISGTVYDAIGNKLSADCEFLGEYQLKHIARPVGEYQLKHIARPVRVYRVILDAAPHRFGHEER
jgi:class 3 adenylate cyclase